MMKKTILTALCALLALCVLSAVPAFADDITFTIEAADTTVGEGAEAAKIDVYFKDVPDVGLEAVKFNLKIEGATFVDADVAEGVPGSYMRSDAGQDWMGFIWLDIAQGIFEDVKIATFIVKLPEGLEAGDELAIEIELSNDPDNYVSFRTDSSTNEEYNLYPVAKNGTITVVPAAQAPAPISLDTLDTENDEDDGGRVDFGPLDTVDLENSSAGSPDGQNAGDGDKANASPADGGTESAAGDAAQVSTDGDAAGSGGLPTGAIIGIIAGSVALIAIVAVIVVKVLGKKPGNGRHDHS